MTTSLKQQAANRRNSEKSTGPKTPAGKQIVSQNATTHGILRDAALIRQGEGVEDAAEFQAVYDRLRREHDPQDFHDEYDIERIAIAYARHKRVQQRDVGLRRLALDAASYKRSARQRAAVHRAVSAVEYGPAGALDGDSAAPLGEEEWALLFQTSEGISYVLRTLEATRQDVLAGHDLSPDALSRLERLFGRARGSIYEWCAAYHARCDRLTNDSDAQAAWDAYRAQVVETLDGEREWLTAERTEILEVEVLDGAAELALHALPDEREYDTLLRYETAFHRQICKAEASLASRKQDRALTLHVGEAQQQGVK